MLGIQKLMVLIAVVGSISACTRKNDSNKNEGRTEIVDPAPPTDQSKTDSQTRNTPKNSTDPRSDETKKKGDDFDDEEVIDPDTQEPIVDVNKPDNTNSGNTNTTPVPAPTPSPSNGNTPVVTGGQQQGQPQQGNANPQTENPIKEQLKEQMGNYTGAATDNLRADLFKEILKLKESDQKLIFAEAAKVSDADLDIDYKTGRFGISLKLNDGASTNDILLCGALDGNREGKLCKGNDQYRIQGKLKCLDQDPYALCSNPDKTYNNCTTALADLKVVDTKSKSEIPLWIIFRRSEVDVNATFPHPASQANAYKDFFTAITAKELYEPTPKVLQTAQLASAEVVAGISKVEFIMMTAEQELMAVQGKLYAPSIIQSQFSGKAPMAVSSAARLAEKEKDPKFKFKFNMHNSIGSAVLLNNSMFIAKEQKTSDLKIGLTLKTKNENGVNDFIVYSLSREKYLNPINKPEFPSVQMVNP